MEISARASESASEARLRVELNRFFARSWVCLLFGMGCIALVVNVDDPLARTIAGIGIMLNFFYALNCRYICTHLLAMSALGQFGAQIVLDLHKMLEEERNGKK
jgi:hypothetical protein